MLTRPSTHTISLNEPRSTVQNLARFLVSSFWEPRSQSPSGSSPDRSSIRSRHPTPLSGSPSSPSSPSFTWVTSLGPAFVQANLKGRDLLKVYFTPMYVPHSMSSFCDLDRISLPRESWARLCFGLHTELKQSSRSAQEPTKVCPWSRY